MATHATHAHSIQHRPIDTYLHQMPMAITQTMSRMVPTTDMPAMSAIVFTCRVAVDDVVVVATADILGSVRAIKNAH